MVPTSPNLPHQHHLLLLLLLLLLPDVVFSPAAREMTGFADTIVTTARHEAWHATYPMSNAPYQPHVAVVGPVFDSFDPTSRRHVGDIVGLFTMEGLLLNLLPQGVRGIMVVVESSCGDVFTFRLDGNQVRFRFRQHELRANEQRRFPHTCMFPPSLI